MMSRCLPSIFTQNEDHRLVPIEVVPLQFEEDVEQRASHQRAVDYIVQVGAQMLEQVRFLGPCECADAHRRPAQLHRCRSRP